MVYLKIGEAAKRLGVDIQTVRVWADAGKIECIKTPSGHRRFDQDYIEQYAQGNADPKKAVLKNEHRAVLYARVSTRKQAEAGNLDRQISRLTQYAIQQNYKIEGIYQEVASGMSENRGQLLKLLNDIQKEKPVTVLVEYKDRLARFGFTYLKKFIEDTGNELVVLEQEEKDEQTELVEDLIAITTSFSTRIYGKRGGKKMATQLKTLIKDGEKDEINETTSP